MPELRVTVDVSELVAYLEYLADRLEEVERRLSALENPIGA